jgi:hypothetical protein
LTLTAQAIDTGTTLIYMPDGIAAQFYAIVCPWLRFLGLIHR